MTITWKASTEEKYWYALEVLPPATQMGLGFLLGEPLDHGICPITGKFGARYEAHIQLGDNSYWVAAEPMTVAGFRHIAKNQALYGVTALRS